MKKWLLGSIAVVLALAGGALAYAPYLPALLHEGLPPLMLPVAKVAAYTPITGSGMPRDLHARSDAATLPLVPELASPFSQKGGRALLVYKDGTLALEHYEGGADADTRFNSFSMAKSLVGALIYKAVAEGKLQSLDQTLGELLPEDRGVAKVTIQRLLTMRAGIHFEGGASVGGISGMDTDGSGNPFGPMARLHFQGLGALEGGLSANLDEGEFNYQNVNTALLGEVLQRLYQRPLEQLMAEKVWQPAMAAPALWREPAIGEPVSAYCCIYATARDWIRVGLFLSENGGATPFLPQPLWRQFMGLDASVDERHANHYGEHVWQNILDRPGENLQGPFTYLFGQGGQLLYLFPEQRVVVYRAGEQVPLLHSTAYGAWNSALAAGT